MCGLISFPSWNFTLKPAEANFYELFNVNWLLGVSSEHLLHAELSSRFPVPVIGSYEKFIENYNFKRAASFLEKSTWLPVKIRTFRYAVFVINNLIAIRYNSTEVNYTRYNIPITVYGNRKNILFLVSKIELLRGFSKRRVLVAILNRAILGNELNKISVKRRKEEKEKKREKKESSTSDRISSPRILTSRLWLIDHPGAQVGDLGFCFQSILEEKIQSIQSMLKKSITSFRRTKFRLGESK